MIEQKLTQYFKQFSRISPRGEFVARSKATVATLPQESPVRAAWIFRIKESLTTGSALALASFLLIALLGGISYVAKTSGQFASRASFNDGALAREAEQLTFQVELKEAQYFDESASQVVRALTKIANDNVTLP